MANLSSLVRRSAASIRRAVSNASTRGSLIGASTLARSRSACACALVQQEADLHDDPELGHAVVLHHGLELLGPDGLDVADRAGHALDRFSDRVLVALRGLARQFDELCYRHRCLPPSLGPAMVRPDPLEGNPLVASPVDLV